MVALVDRRPADDLAISRPLMLIRSFKPEDAVAVADLYAPYVRETTITFEFDPPSPAQLAERFGAMQAAGYPVLVAERDGRVIAYAYASSFRARPAYRLTVENSVYVDRAHQRTGAGRALMQRLIEECRTRGMRQMIGVIADAEGSRSIEFHQSLGFRVAGRLEGVGIKFGREVGITFVQLPLGDSNREHWNARYRERPELAAPSSFLLSLDDVLPRTGRALDVAGGSGRNALWLAGRGLDVTLSDFSAEGLAIARRVAHERGVALNTLETDLEQAPFPAGPWDVITCFYFLHRPLFAAIERALAPGGFLVFAHSTRKNLERHPRPGPRHLLDEGELPRLVTNLEIVRYDEGWTDDGHHEARLVARRPR